MNNSRLTKAILAIQDWEVRDEVVSALIEYNEALLDNLDPRCKHKKTTRVSTDDVDYFECEDCHEQFSESEITDMDDKKL